MADWDNVGLKAEDDILARVSQAAIQTSQPVVGRKRILCGGAHGTESR